MVLALNDQDGDGPSALGSSMRPLLAATDDLILASGETARDSLWHVADEARRGRLGVLIATTAARLAVVIGGDTSAWLREGGSA
jgi:hypothetical protein